MKYLNLYCPLSTEHLWDFIAEVLDKNKIEFGSFKNKSLKKEVLEIISKLLNDNLIYVGNEWLNQSTIKRWNLSNEEIIKKIDEIWFESAEYPDFFNMIWFGFEDWYKNKIKNLGMTNTINWETFVNYKIGDLEKWIEENKPKNNIDNKK